MTRMEWRMATAISHHAAAAVLALLALAAAAPSAAVAADDSGAYEVEILVFRNLDQRGNTTEVPVPAGQATTAVAPALPAPGAAVGVPATGLDPGELRLTSLATRLRRGPAYQLVYHGGWRQAAVPRAQAQPTTLPAAAAQAGLGGTVTLYRDRYLHALLDLSLPAESGAAGQVWHIRQGRRLRGDALQYFDQPGFGVILAVRSPAGTADTAPASATDEEP
ncbi:hypothetical protein GPROT2_01945 [Gammaproteobacteria bacterium]|nr:hypothetical protein GPROT2_01945 [Gammaproteobacteria bacterium]